MVNYLRVLYQIITRNAYLIIWCSIAILGLITLYVRVKVIFLVNPDAGGIESNVIYSVLRMLAGFPLYQNPEQVPYPITQYSPIYYYLIAGVSRLVRLTSNDVYEVYIVGRSICLLANIGYTWGIVWLARRLQVVTSVSLLVGITAFVLLPPQSYGRPDSLYNAFVIWTLWAVLRCLDSSSRKSLVYETALAAALAATALFSKQSAICLPIIISAYWGLFNKKPWPLLLFLGWYLLALVLLYYALFQLDNTFLYSNLVQGINNGMDLANFRQNLVNHYLRPFAWLVVPSLAICIRYIVLGDGARQFVGLATLGLFLFAVTTGVKLGAALNYFTEFTGLSCLLIADMLFHLRINHSEWANAGRLGLLLVVIGVVPINAMNFNWERTVGKPVDMTLYQRNELVAQYIKNELRKCNNCFVYNTLHNISYLNLFLFKSCILPQHEIVVESAYPRKSFDYTDLERAAQDGRIHFVISQDTKTEMPMVPPVYLANYKRIKSLEGYTIYKFNKPTGQLAGFVGKAKVE